mgnify:CR=1 FL=1
MSINVVSGSLTLDVVQEMIESAERLIVAQDLEATHMTEREQAIAETIETIAVLIDAMTATEAETVLAATIVTDVTIAEIAPVDAQVVETEAEAIVAVGIDIIGADVILAPGLGLDRDQNRQETIDLAPDHPGIEEITIEEIVVKRVGIDVIVTDLLASLAVDVEEIEETASVSNLMSKMTIKIASRVTMITNKMDLMTMAALVKTIHLEMVAIRVWMARTMVPMIRVKKVEFISQRTITSIML